MPFYIHRIRFSYSWMAENQEAVDRYSRRILLPSKVLFILSVVSLASLQNQKSNSSNMLEILQLVFSYLENKLLLISINFTPKTSHSCLKKWYTIFSRYVLIDFSFQGLVFWGLFGGVVGHAIPCGGGCGCYWRFGRCGARNCCFSVLEVLRSWCALKGWMSPSLRGSGW